MKSVVKAVVVLVMLIGLAFALPVSAHKKGISTQKECAGKKVPKKYHKACKACLTKHKKQGHYHPWGTKGKRCHKKK